MSARAVAALVLLLAALAGGAIAADVDEDDPGSGSELADSSGEPGGVPAPVQPSETKGLDLRPLWIVGWVAIAAVAGMVVISSLTKVRPVPGDPLVTAPGVVARASRVPFVIVPAGTAFEAGRDLAYRASPATVEHALSLMSVLDLGHASLISDRRGEKVVEVVGCSSCRERGSRWRPLRRKRPAEECAFERGFLHGAIEMAIGREVAVHEARCGAVRGTACRFKIRY